MIKLDEIKKRYQALGKKEKLSLWLVIIAVFAILGQLNQNELVKKQFIYMDQRLDVNGVISFESNSSCHFFFKSGYPYKQEISNLGKWEEKVIDKNKSEIYFTWDKGFGPKVAKLKKSRHPWKLSYEIFTY